jgi:hypothetical protein
MAGRPTKLSDEILRKIEEVAALDGTIEEMAYYANIHRATLYRWIEDDDELRDRIQELRERPILLARQTVVKSLSEPDHAFKYLERKKKSEFAQRVEQTGKDGERLIPESFTPEQRNDLLSLLNGNDEESPSESN